MCTWMCTWIVVIRLFLHPLFSVSWLLRWSVTYHADIQTRYAQRGPPRASRAGDTWLKRSFLRVARPHDPTQAGIIHWVHDGIDPECSGPAWYGVAFRKACEYWPLTRKGSMTVSSVPPTTRHYPSIICLIVWQSAHSGGFSRIRSSLTGFFDVCWITQTSGCHIRCWNRRRSAGDLCNFGIRHHDKGHLDCGVRKEREESEGARTELERHISWSTLHNGPAARRECCGGETYCERAVLLMLLKNSSPPKPLVIR